MPEKYNKTKFTRVSTRQNDLVKKHAKKQKVSEAEVVRRQIDKLK